MIIYVNTSDLVSLLGRYISSLEKRNEPGILWTHDKSRSSRGGYPVKAYQVTEQLLAAIGNYCNKHNFQLYIDEKIAKTGIRLAGDSID